MPTVRKNIYFIIIYFKSDPNSRGLNCVSGNIIEKHQQSKRIKRIALHDLNWKMACKKLTAAVCSSNVLV